MMELSGGFNGGSPGGLTVGVPSKARTAMLHATTMNAQDRNIAGLAVGGLRITGGELVEA